MSLRVDALASLGSFWLIFATAVAIKLVFRHGRSRGDR